MSDFAKELSDFISENYESREAFVRKINFYAREKVLTSRALTNHVNGQQPSAKVKALYMLMMAIKKSEDVSKAKDDLITKLLKR